MTMFGRIIAACALPLLLTGCLLAPGKFTSSFDIRADRSFTFTYKGELIAQDPSDSMSGLTTSSDGGPEDKAEAARQAKEKADKSRERESKYRALAATLAKEAGYRSVVYKGGGRFEVDYAIRGLLTTNFLFPFNSDAEVVIPFVAAEVRKDGTVRIKAPAFGKGAAPSAAMGQIPMMGEPDNPAEGTFTITTDAEIVMHNQEEGVTAGPNGKTIAWTVGAIKKDAPTAVIRLQD